ncbi:error-prone DNA polymerase [Aureimonas sp. AU40]|uniref:error-prone DNA polymerase n=1 Tax=Aureimonas sp. AU40 TaxID=1637747 RepID=UPI000784316C|nr:error-prone DNA polymerase [Aureimonas sp. AU40]
MSGKGLLAPGPGFCEIGAASTFSFLRGVSQPGEMVVAAKTLALGGLGLADRNTLAGVVRAYGQAELAEMPFRPGARLVFRDETPDLFAYPRDRAAWGRLCRLLTVGNLRAPKGECHLDLADLLEWGEGLNLALLAPDALGGDEAAGGEAERRLRAALNPLAHAFPGALRLALAPRLDGGDRRRLARAQILAKACRAPLLATNDAFYHGEDRRPLSDVVTGIREHVPLAQAGFRLARNGERRLKHEGEMLRLFRGFEGAIGEARRFFEELDFDLASLKYDYPDEALGLSVSPAEELRRLAREGAVRRYHPKPVPDSIWSRIETEMALIEKKKYEPYFLTVHRIVDAAREMKILCQGRGSAANSVVCYCLGVTEVHPDKAGLLFDRFISADRDEPPDIDIDFEHERRDDVIRWIYDFYGRDSAAIAATVITYRARSAAREVGQCFGLSEDALSALSGSVWGYSASDLGAREAEAAGLSAEDRTTRHVLDFARQLAGFPRHLSQHVGGFVLTRGRVDETVPVLNTGSKGRIIVEWDKDDLDTLGILKIDILALGMLSCLRRAFDMLNKLYPGEATGDGRPATLDTLPVEPKNGPVWKMTHRADTLGTFQIESRAQMSMLPKLKPNEFYDLVIQVAIVRPGPIQGDMVHPYLRRRMKLEDVTYPKEELRQILWRTEGVPLFQEQAMRIAMVAAGFTGAEADKLRRAMATFKRTGQVTHFKERMISGMVAKGYEPDFAARCFSQIEGFGEYGFPESHAASFALLVYASAFIKCHYPDVFAASLLNSQPMGFYAPSQIVRDAQEHGVEVRAVCVNRSSWDMTMEPARFDPRRIHPRHREMARDIRSRHAIRLGFRQVKGLGEGEMRRLGWVRDSTGPFRSLHDLRQRAGLSRRTLERLADADAFTDLGLTRREALWAVQGLDEPVEDLPLFAASRGADLRPEAPAALPDMPEGEEVVNDYRFLSLSLKAHPVSFLRGHLADLGIAQTVALEGVRPGRRVDVAGLVLIRQRPGSAKGVVFITVEDETGVANIVVWKHVFERFRSVVLGARFIRISGRLQRDHGVQHLVADRLEDLSPLLAHLSRSGLAKTNTLQPADHVRKPLRYHGNERALQRPISPEVVEAASALGAVLSRADEFRHPQPEGRVNLHRTPREGRLLPSAPDGQDIREAHSVLPKGRNFH